MISAAFRAANDVLSPRFRSVLWKSVGLTLLLFAGLLVLIWVGSSALLTLPWPWLDEVIAAIASVGLLVALFFLMSPVTALFAGLFLDTVAEVVENKHYASDPQGRPPSALSSALIGVQFGSLVLLINLLLLPAIFLGIGAIILLVVNSYLLSREYFTMVAVRHMPIAQAHLFRKANASRIWAAGLIPAGLALVPFLNILVPLFATSYFVHIYKRIRQDEPLPVAV